MASEIALAREEISDCGIDVLQGGHNPFIRHGPQIAKDTSPVASDARFTFADKFDVKVKSASLQSVASEILGLLRNGPSFKIVKSLFCHHCHNISIPLIETISLLNLIICHQQSMTPPFRGRQMLSTS